MRYLLIVLLSVFGTTSFSQNQNLISVDEIIEIIEASGSVQVERQVLLIDEETIDAFSVGYGRTSEEALDRMLQAFRTTYFGEKIISVGFENPLLSFSALEKDGRVVLVRFWIPTSVYSREEDLSLAMMLTHQAIEALLDTPLEFDLEDTIGSIWSTRAFVQFPEPLGRLHAWGVPPDFIEFVVTGRPDCPFIPEKGWIARFICE